MAAFTWGAGGQKITTPEQARNARKVAEALMNQGKATNWGEGLARVAGAFSANALNDRAAMAETEGAQSAAAALAGLGVGSDPNAIIGALSNPWLSQPQASVASALLNSGLERQDPMYQLQLQQLQMETDAMRNPQPSLYDPNAPTSFQEWQLGQVNPEYGATLGDSPLVQVNTGDTNDFFSGLSSAEGENFAGFLTAGQGAARNMMQVDRLEGLLSQTPGGLEGGANLIAGNLGIDLGNASGVQAAQALINTMVPAQRPPGSGPMSDADLELYKQSLPRIINQPGGNELIIETLRGINQYDLELARITQEGLARAEMTDDPQVRAQIKREMRQQINSLANPVDRVRNFLGSSQPTSPGNVTIRKIAD